MIGDELIAAYTERSDHSGDTPRRPRRARATLLILGAVVLLGATGYWFLVLRESNPDSATGSSGPAATAEVTRKTISATEAWNGTLGYGSPFTATTSGEGTVTGLAKPNSEVVRGTELFRLNERPVTAMYGATPMYRDLKSGDTGVDVNQLEANLAALGYTGFDVDEEFTWNTSIAVREWQEDLEIEETGVVRRSDVVFVPEGGRVHEAHVAVGDIVRPGTDVLDITGSDQVVTMEVDVADRGLVKVGTDVTIRLPGGKEVPGTVTREAVVEDEQDDGGDGGGGGGGPGDQGAGADDSVTAVEVTLTTSVDPALLGSPVDVVVDVETRADVLVVPVSALLALSEGGFGLEVVAPDGTTSVVPVETGLFANGTVEVSGQGISEGTVVGVAGR